VPVRIGGISVAGLRGRARSDGWIGTYTDLDDVRRMIAIVAARREEAGASGEFTITLAAMPGASRDADALDECGVEALMLPAVALASTTATTDVIAGLERFAERRMR
jgi:hypothetical protein